MMSCCPLAGLGGTATEAVAKAHGVKGTSEQSGKGLRIQRLPLGENLGRGWRPFSRRRPESAELRVMWGINRATAPGCARIVLVVRRVTQKPLGAVAMSVLWMVGGPSWRRGKRERRLVCQRSL